jgi:hypothetical protein
MDQPGSNFVKKTHFAAVLAAPMLMFVMTLPSHADAETAAAAAPTRMCKDGTTSTAMGKGACSGHGGVQKAKKAAAAAAAPATAAAPAKTAAPAAPAADGAAPAGATAKCKDGTYSKAKSHKGACSKHGGVDSFLTP